MLFLFDFYIIENAILYFNLFFFLLKVQYCGNETRLARFFTSTLQYDVRRKQEPTTEKL